MGSRALRHTGVILGVIPLIGGACGIKAADVPATFAYEVIGGGSVFMGGSRRPAGAVHEVYMERIFAVPRRIESGEEDTSLVLTTVDGSTDAMLYGATRKSIYKAHGIRALKQCESHQVEARVAGTTAWHFIGGSTLSEYAADEDLSRRTFFRLGDLFPRNARSERPSSFIWEVYRGLPPGDHELELRWTVDCERRDGEAWQILMVTDQLTLSIDDDTRLAALRRLDYAVEPTKESYNTAFVGLARKLLADEGKLRIVRPDPTWEIHHHPISHAVVRRSFGVDYVYVDEEGECRFMKTEISQAFLQGRWQRATRNGNPFSLWVDCDSLPRR